MDLVFIGPLSNFLDRQRFWDRLLSSMGSISNICPSNNEPREYMRFYLSCGLLRLSKKPVHCKKKNEVGEETWGAHMASSAREAHAGKSVYIVEGGFWIKMWKSTCGTFSCWFFWVACFLTYSCCTSLVVRPEYGYYSSMCGCWMLVTTKRLVRWSKHCIGAVSIVFYVFFDFMRCEKLIQVVLCCHLLRITCNILNFVRALITLQWDGHSVWTWFWAVECLWFIYNGTRGCRTCWKLCCLFR